MRLIELFLFALIFTFLYSCSEEVTPPASVSHPPEWMSSNAENFHGNKVIASGSESCKSCHGAEFEGGTSGVSCSKCHGIYPHPPEWTIPDNPQSHGEYLDEGGGSIQECRACHGEDLDGGSSGIACSVCHGSHDNDD
jgi:hypothetical protein